MQTAHSIADFAAEHPQKFSQWKNESNSIISLSTDNEETLLKLYEKYKDKTDVVLFYEPDIDAYTSLCMYGTPSIRKKLSHLPLSLKKLNRLGIVENSTSDHQSIGNKETTIEEKVANSSSIIVGSSSLPQATNSGNSSSAEQRSLKPSVVGSTPTSRTIVEDDEEETTCPDHTPYWGVCSTCGCY